MMSKKPRCLRMRMESLPHDVVEGILDRLPVDSMVRFKAVSKQWKSTIESSFFKERQLTKRQQSGDPDVLMVTVKTITPHDVGFDISTESLRTLVLGSSSSVKISTPWEDTHYFVSHGSCDGLVCLYNHNKSGFVINPTTRWYRTLPLCQLQQLITNLGISYHKLNHSVFKLGFGKDKFMGTYKPVWLYNSSEIGLENATTCEVFDFSTNAWRYVTPGAPFRIAGFPDPVYFDGSLHWFTECQETKILSFDLHTEAFQVVCKAPFANVHGYRMIMCNLDNRLCVSEMQWHNQVIWSFDSGNKTWHKMCSIDLEVTSHLIGRPLSTFWLLALFDGDKNKKKKKKLLFCDPVSGRALVILDLETKSYHIAFDAHSTGYPVCYFQSLISIS